MKKLPERILAPEGARGGGGGAQAVFDAPPIEPDNLNEPDDNPAPDPDSVVDFGLGPMPGADYGADQPYPGTPEYAAQQQQGQQSQQGQGQGGSLSVDDVARIAQAMASANQPQAAPAQPQQQMSREELAAQLGKFNADEELAQQIVDAEDSQTRAKALNRMIDGIYGHVYNVVNAYGQGLQQNFSSQMQPLTEMQRRTERDDFKKTLTQYYPALQGKELLVEQVMDSMGGYNPSTNNPWEPYQIVASRVQQIIDSVAPGQNSGGLQQPQATMPPMAAMPSGNGSGGAGGNANGQSSSPGVFGKGHWKKVDIWGDRR
jgi:hypothetical protein